MTHAYQLKTYGAPLLVQYIQFICNQSNDSITTFQQYLIQQRNLNNNIEYLQSCYVNNIFYGHDKYISPDFELEMYRTQTYNTL